MKTTENSYYELKSIIDKIIDFNCQEIPYEGTEVDKPTMSHEILNLLFQDRIEFARMHVEAALKAASMSAEMRIIKYTDDYEIDRTSILTSYPKENIK